MKQFLSACLAVLLLAVLLVLPAAAEETADAPNLTPGFSVTAEAAYVANTDTGLVVYEKQRNPHAPPPACTKLLMTTDPDAGKLPYRADTISITAPAGIWRLPVRQKCFHGGYLERRDSIPPAQACCMLRAAAPAPTRQRISWQTHTSGSSIADNPVPG
ncbi:MAG: hypothetical protein ACLT8A_11385 [Subdoligranulum sp.]